jgi:hypothetical protein
MEIVSQLPVMEPNKQYGNIISSVNFLNAFPFFLLPVTLWLFKEESKAGKKFNSIVQVIEYVPTLLVASAIFIAVNVVLIVPAYFKIVYIKFLAIFDNDNEASLLRAIVVFLGWLFIGPLVVFVYFVFDIGRFLKNLAYF